MHPADQLTQILTDLGPQACRGSFYRAVRLDFLATLTSARHVKSGANRYTPPDLSEAQYLADNADQAMLEASRQFQRQFSTPEIPAYIIYPARVRLQRVLDLTDDLVQDVLGTSIEELTGDWRAAFAQGRRVVSHDLGRAVFTLGWQGIRYPSAYNQMDARQNLVVFTEHIGPGAIREELPEAALKAIEVLNRPEASRD